MTSKELFGHGARAVNHRREIIYSPEVCPGFTAWVTGFDYGGGRVGVSFKETIRQKNPAFIPPRLEMGEAVGAPVSYSSIECGSESELSMRVYMASDDGGKSFYETGRCLLEEGSFCNIGFPDGRIVGLDVPRINAERTGWYEGIRVRESKDGGSSWMDREILLPGTAPYLWRVRRLKDGTIIVMACLYGTPWGQGKARATRNTMLPGESYINKIQTFFFASKDGVEFSGPHYILPGTGAHEYDMIERSDGSLLFIAGDVQATQVARQVVTRHGEDFVNGALLSIRRGAPTDPSMSPQGGFVPESIVALPGGLILGARRGKPYSCSNDDGENWFEIDFLPHSLYQPFMMLMPNGEIANFGHFGGDNAFGEVDMYIGADFFLVESGLPATCKLELVRSLSNDQSHYENSYAARLFSGERGIPDQTIFFRISPVWREDGNVNTAPQGEAPMQLSARTNAEGWAKISIPELDKIPDIHHYCNVDVVFAGSDDGRFSACGGPMMCCASLTPRRRELFPHAAYFANGVLYLAPWLVNDYPKAAELLAERTDEGGEALLTEGIPQALLDILTEAGALTASGGKLLWYRSVHCRRPLDEVREAVSGDWYV